MTKVTPPRRITTDLLATISTELPDSIQQALSYINTHRGEWYVLAGPWPGHLARVRSSQANHGKRWRSITNQYPTIRFRSWTDPDSHQVYVLAMVPV